MQSDKRRGVITSWISGRGFGFITEDGQDANVVREKFYCHISRITGKPVIGAGKQVRFNVLAEREGTKRSAIEVEIIDTVDAASAGERSAQ